MASGNIFTRDICIFVVVVKWLAKSAQDQQVLGFSREHAVLQIFVVRSLRKRREYKETETLSYAAF